MLCPECLLFPSKDQRNWNKWDKENNHKTPKTWNELCLAAQVEEIEVSTDVIFDDSDNMIDRSHAVGSNLELAKAALALLKIHQLIEVGYGGNVTDEEWYKEIGVYYICLGVGIHDKFYINFTSLYSNKRHIAFHTKEQAKEFLKYEENIQLLKDYFIMN